MTVAALLKKLEGVPPDAEVILRVKDRNAEGLRVINFHYAEDEDIGGTIPDAFIITGYGRKELEQQEKDAAARRDE
jgi:hypothetical protein